MFQYAVNYTKKYLIDSLVCKIRLLKILSNTTSNKMAEKVKLIEKIGKTSISKPVLDFLGVTMSDYKILTTIPATNPAEKENPEENGSLKKDEPKPITASLVLSSRVKPLEELPPIATPEKSSDDSKPTSTSTSMYDNMLSPYNNVPNAKEKQRRNSKSPASKTKEEEQPSES